MIGNSLVPRLIERGHSVTAMTRSQERADRLAVLGARPVVCDVYEAARVEDSIRHAQPDVVVHQLTALPPAIHPRRIADQLAENDRIRIEGTRNLVGVALNAGIKRIVAQSIAFCICSAGRTGKRRDGSALDGSSLALESDGFRNGRSGATGDFSRRCRRGSTSLRVSLRRGYSVCL